MRLVIVVPTIVLMLQWYDAILESGNLPAEAIGRLGGGYDEDFQGRRILIAVLASASQRLAKLVKESEIEDHLLFVVDECHNSGADEMSHVLRTRCRWSLGLSATPERDEIGDGYDKSVVGRKLGPIIYEFNLADALRDGLIPKYTIHHFGLNMTLDERKRYEQLSRSITDAMSQLKGLRDPARMAIFFPGHGASPREIKARPVQSPCDLFPTPQSVGAWLLLNHLDARYDAVMRLIRREFAVNPDAQDHFVSRSHDMMKNIFGSLWQNGFSAIAEHSELPNSTREAGLELFRRGLARIIVSGPVTY